MSGTLKRPFSKGNQHFLGKNQFPDKGLMLSISQERATLHGLGEEICQKYLGFFI